MKLRWKIYVLSETMSDKIFKSYWDKQFCTIRKQYWKFGKNALISPIQRPPAITRRALKIAENYCPRTKIVIKFFFQSFTKTKLPFCRICNDAFFILIQFLCNLNRFLDNKLKTLNFSSPKMIENQCFSKHKLLLLGNRFFLSVDVEYFS